MTDKNKSNKKQPVTTYTFPKGEREKWLEKNDSPSPETIGLRECTLKIEQLAIERAVEGKTSPALEMVKLCVIELDGEVVEVNAVNAFFNKAPKSMRDLVREAWAMNTMCEEEDRKSFFASKTKTF